MRSLGAGGAALGQNRKRRVHYAGESALGDASQMLGKNTLIGKFGGVIGPANLQNPAIFSWERIHRGDFRCGNDEERLEMQIERADLVHSNKKLDGCWGGVSRMVFSAIYDDERA